MVPKRLRRPRPRPARAQSPVPTIWVACRASDDDPQTANCKSANPNAPPSIHPRDALLQGGAKVLEPVPLMLTQTSEFVMAGLDPAIPILGARPCHGHRDRRDKPGDDEGGCVNS